MKIKILFSSLFMLLGFAVTGVNAQNNSPVYEKRSGLIILVRHAEKADDSADPELTEAGKQRAQRLIKAIGKYKPGAFYSTNFIRTRETIAPIAQKRKKTVEIYDHRKPQDLVDKMMQSKIKRMVVAGHSNSSPMLANLIMKKEVFQKLDESVYSVIWLIRIKNGKVTKVEVLDY